MDGQLPVTRSLIEYGLNEDLERSIPLVCSAQFRWWVLGFWSGVQFVQPRASPLCFNSPDELQHACASQETLSIIYRERDAARPTWVLRSQSQSGDVTPKFRVSS